MPRLTATDFKTATLGFLSVLSWLVCLTGVGYDLVLLVVSLPFVLAWLWFILRITGGKHPLKDYLLDIFLYPTNASGALVKTFKERR